MAATLYALVTGHKPAASILRDRNPLPLTCDRTPNLSPRVSQLSRLPPAGAG